MSELPSGWAKVTLSEICQFNPKHDADLDRQTQVSFVPMPAVSEETGSINQHDSRPLQEVWSGYTHFQDGDVIFAKITPCMENGKIAVARALTNGIACGSTEFHVLRPAHGILAPYIWRFLRQESFRRDAEASMTGAVGQRRVPKSFLEKSAIPLPPTAEQRRVVAKLDQLFERTTSAREELAHIPTLVDHYKQAILRKAFSGELTAAWREKIGRDDPNTVELGSVALDFSYGSAAKSAPTGRVPVLRMGNIQDGKLDWSDLVFTSDEHEINKYALSPGDVLFNRTNSPALVGKTALYTGEQPAIYAGYLIRVRCGERLDPRYLTYALNSPDGRDYCWQVKTDGVSQSNINAKKLAAFSFLLPKVDEQREIVRLIAEAFDWIERVSSERDKAATLLNHLNSGLLSKAFRGELVPQDPNNEPADRLLECIRSEREAQAPTSQGRRARAGT